MAAQRCPSVYVFPSAPPRSPTRQRVPAHPFDHDQDEHVLSPRTIDALRLNFVPGSQLPPMNRAAVLEAVKDDLRKGKCKNMSAYCLFSRFRREGIAKHLAERGDRVKPAAQDVSKCISMEWTALSLDDKKFWASLEAALDRFLTQKAAYDRQQNAAESLAMLRTQRSDLTTVPTSFARSRPRHLSSLTRRGSSETIAMPDTPVTPAAPPWPSSKTPIISYPAVPLNIVAPVYDEPLSPALSTPGLVPSGTPYYTPYGSPRSVSAMPISPINQSSFVLPSPTASVYEPQGWQIDESCPSASSYLPPSPPASPTVWEPWHPALTWPPMSHQPFALPSKIRDGRRESSKDGDAISFASSASSRSLASPARSRSSTLSESDASYESSFDLSAFPRPPGWLPRRHSGAQSMASCNLPAFVARGVLPPPKAQTHPTMSTSPADYVLR